MTGREQVSRIAGQADGGEQGSGGRCTVVGGSRFWHGVRAGTELEQGLLTGAAAGGPVRPHRLVVALQETSLVPTSVHICPEPRAHLNTLPSSSPLRRCPFWRPPATTRHRPSSSGPSTSPSTTHCHPCPPPGPCSARPACPQHQPSCPPQPLRQYPYRPRPHTGWCLQDPRLSPHPGLGSHPQRPLPCRRTAKPTRGTRRSLWRDGGTRRTPPFLQAQAQGLRRRFPTWRTSAGALGTRMQGATTGAATLAAAAVRLLSLYGTTFPPRHSLALLPAVRTCCRPLMRQQLNLRNHQRNRQQLQPLPQEPQGWAGRRRGANRRHLRHGRSLRPQSTTGITLGPGATPGAHTLVPLATAGGRRPTARPRLVAATGPRAGRGPQAAGPRCTLHTIGHRRTASRRFIGPSTLRTAGMRWAGSRHTTWGRHLRRTGTNGWTHTCGTRPTGIRRAGGDGGIRRTFASGRSGSLPSRSSSRPRAPSSRASPPCHPAWGCPRASGPASPPQPLQPLLHLPSRPLQQLPLLPSQPLHRQHLPLPHRLPSTRSPQPPPPHRTQQSRHNRQPHSRPLRPPGRQPKPQRPRPTLPLHSLLFPPQQRPRAPLRPLQRPPECQARPQVVPPAPLPQAPTTWTSCHRTCAATLRHSPLPLPLRRPRPNLFRRLRPLHRPAEKQLRRRPRKARRPYQPWRAPAGRTLPGQRRQRGRRRRRRLLDVCRSLAVARFCRWCSWTPPSCP